MLGAAADDGLDGAVLGMAHRGRLNVLANIVGKSYDQIFREFEGYVDPTSVQGSGDVKYHLGAVGQVREPDGRRHQGGAGRQPHRTSRPSTRSCSAWCGPARTRSTGPTRFSVLPVLLHGDAAFAGQGVVAECLNMSDISGYRVGGTIHLVINNQLGFTTSPEYARSSQYATDVAKMIQAPIFHVNGDDPEACVRVARLAYDYRQRFHKDVVIDIVCYRRYGHNEGDDPSYTQPLMYQAIERHRSVRKLFTESLVKRGDITLDEAEAALDDFQHRLQQALDETRSAAPAVRAGGPAAGADRRAAPRRDRRADAAELDRIFDHFTDYPEGFTPHPKLARQFEARSKLYHEQGEVEWATAELLAFGDAGASRATRSAWPGEDSRRGTFSQRHAGLVDYDTGKTWVPIATLPGKKAKFWVYDSLLSEYAAARLRVRLPRRQQGRPRAVGGAVRRLHERRPDRSSTSTSWPPRTSGTRRRAW